MVKILISCVITAVLTSNLAFAAPEPAVVPKPGDWTLEVRFENPQQIILPGAIPQRFWYIILTLTNKSDKDVDFYPVCELVTDTLQVVPAVKGVSTVLFDRIENRHHGKYPFLMALDMADDKILQGRDNTEDIAVIWPDFDPNAKSIDIFISGLSNETAVIDHPIEKGKDGAPVKIYLRKTLQLTCSIAGDPKFRDKQKLKLENKQWVMR
jgi:hypothetical protein